MDNKAQISVEYLTMLDLVYLVSMVYILAALQLGAVLIGILSSAVVLRTCQGHERVQADLSPIVEFYYRYRPHV